MGLYTQQQLQEVEIYREDEVYKESPSPKKKILNKTLWAALWWKYKIFWRKRQKFNKAGMENVEAIDPINPSGVK